MGSSPLEGEASAHVMLALLQAPLRRSRTGLKPAEAPLTEMSAFWLAGAVKEYHTSSSDLPVIPLHKMALADWVAPTVVPEISSQAGVTAIGCAEAHSLLAGVL